ncbi:MAG: PEP-CTERM sorting domain-containing protein [Phenylobacterium sp.]|nr:MAG: PEP-CTERM sorting domain-containing protein [Phenylobacterium sp.]
MSVSGSFVYDKDLVTGGLILVPFATLAVDPDSAFTFDIGSLGFDLGDAVTGSMGITPAIQFNNGVFNGFNYVSDFQYTNGSTYRLRFNSKNFQIKQVDPQTGFNIGSTVYVQGNLSATLANERAYVAPGGGDPGVPEPGTWALMLLGFGTAGAMLRRRRAVAA